MPGVAFESCALSHIGHVREINEDAYICRDDAGIWAVADGLGGHEAGELASRAVVSALEHIIESESLEAQISAVKDALKQVNRDLRGPDPGLASARTPGSTVAVLLVRSHQQTGDCAVAWAGDSRIYRLRDGRARLLTRDHSHVQLLLDEGLIEPQEADAHPMAHAITRAIGISGDIDIETAQSDSRPGDRFVLCSDGLSRLLSDDEIGSIGGCGTAKEATSALLAEALKRGAPDNVTVICVDRLE
ncbi:MAG: protein phosphatase 2C domain-containing protein [Xanthomonadales bacterium]|nr:protein phosphatase 2C domain-containing protein [Xanthomonadales bacterium]